MEPAESNPWACMEPVDFIPSPPLGTSALGPWASVNIEQNLVYTYYEEPHEVTEEWWQKLLEIVREKQLTKDDGLLQESAGSCCREP